jgi:hypothetical protein
MASGRAYHSRALRRMRMVQRRLVHDQHATVLHLTTPKGKTWTGVIVGPTVALRAVRTRILCESRLQAEFEFPRTT